MPQYKKILRGKYCLRRYTPAKPVAYVDDLYEILITHWVYDDTVYADERQRVQVAAGLIMAAYFGCRPCSMFDTRVTFAKTDEMHDAKNNAEVIRNRNGNTSDSNSSSEETLVNSDSHSVDELSSNTDIDSDSDSDIEIDVDSYGNSDGSGNRDVHGDCDSDGDSDGDNDGDSDSGTDDGYHAGTEETRSILYRHIRIIVVRKPTCGGSNIILMKVTLLHTKGEDNKPKM